MSVEPCPTCRSGRVDCPYCGGLGGLVCEVCRGTGKVECPACAGQGTVAGGEDCPDCRWGRVDCDACDGSGRAACASRRCRQGTVTCPECGGLLPGDPAPPRKAPVERTMRRAAGVAPVLTRPANATAPVETAAPATGWVRGTARWFWLGPAALLGLAALAVAERAPAPAPPDPRPALATSQARAAGASASPQAGRAGGNAPLWEPPTARPTVAASTPGQWVEVANTGGEGVFIRFTPRASDRVTAWPESTRMQIVGGDVEADGRRWKNVRDPDGLVGWIPAEYLRPTAAP